MRYITTLVKNHALLTFFALAYSITWTLVLLTPVSMVFALLGLFGPALAAIVVTALIEGRAGVKALLARLAQWRLGWVWYAVVFGLPLACAIAVVGAHLLLGGTFTFSFADGAGLSLVLGILVVGEELGWRGFALPRMQARFGALNASLLLGLLWATWHLVNVSIPGLEYYGYGFPAFLLFVVSQSVLFTWIANGTKASVLLSWLFHAAINISGAMFFIGDQVRSWWLTGIAYSLVALVVILVTGTNLARRPAARAAMASDPALGESVGTLSSGV